MFKNYVLDNKQNIIGNICDLITFPSVSIEEPDSPLSIWKRL